MSTLVGGGGGGGGAVAIISISSDILSRLLAHKKMTMINIECNARIYFQESIPRKGII